jgi:hypothetical protein
MFELFGSGKNNTDFTTPKCGAEASFADNWRIINI